MNQVLSFICVLSGFVSKIALELRLCYVSQADPDTCYSSYFSPKVTAASKGDSGELKSYRRVR